MQVSASLGLKVPAPAAGGAAAGPKATGAAAHQEVDLMGGLDDEPAAAVGTQHAVHCTAVHPDWPIFYVHFETDRPESCARHVRQQADGACRTLVRGHLETLGTLSRVLEAVQPLRSQRLAMTARGPPLAGKMASRSQRRQLHLQILWR